MQIDLTDEENRVLSQALKHWHYQLGKSEKISPERKKRDTEIARAIRAKLQGVEPNPTFACGNCGNNAETVDGLFCSECGQPVVQTEYDGSLSGPEGGA